MTKDPFPREAIFIKWGRLQIGAYGPLAIILLLTAMIFAARIFGVF